MLKKIGIATLVLAGALAFAAPKAHAGVHFGIGVGVAPVVPAVPAVPASPGPYAYPYGYDYGYPYPAYGPYAYPYVGPSVGFGFGFGGHDYHSVPAYRNFGHAGGFHEGGSHWGHRR